MLFWQLVQILAYCGKQVSVWIYAQQVLCVAGSMRMMASGDVIAIPLAERLREKARAARMAATVPSRADHPEPAVAIAPLVAEGALAFAVAGAAHRHQVLASPSQSGASTPESRWHSAFGSTAGIFSGYILLMLPSQIVGASAWPYLHCITALSDGHLLKPQL